MLTSMQKFWDVKECWIQNFSKFAVTETNILELRFSYHYPRRILWMSDVARLILEAR